MNVYLVTIGSGTAKPSGAPQLTSGFLIGFVLLDISFSVQCFVDHCLSFSFGHNIVCLSAM